MKHLLHGLLSQFILRSWRREPLRVLATVFGVALGLAVIVAIELSKQSSVDSFRESLNEMSGQAALEIRGPQGVPESQIPQLYGLREFGIVCPVLEADAFVADWKQQFHVLGVDMLRDRSLREYQLVEFADRRSQPTAAEFQALLSAPDAVIISQKLATRKQLQLGSTFPAIFSDRRVNLRVSGILQPRGIAQAMDGNLLIMDIGAVQWHSGKMGKVDRLEIKPNLQAEGNLVVWEEKIRALLPVGLTVGRPGRRGDEVEKMLAAYHFNLTLLGGIAFLAGLCVLYNSISLSVLGRRSEIGMLRTLGTPRHSILALFLGESLVFGLLGSGLGVGIGRLMAQVAVKLQETTTQSLYGQLGSAEPQLSAGFLVFTLVLGMGMALVAAWLPAREASRISPLEALAYRPNPPAHGERKRRWAGGILTLLAVTACFLPPIGHQPWGGVLACFLAVVALGLWLPDFLSLALRIATPWARKQGGPAWHLGLAGLRAGRQRLGIPLAALAGTLALSAAIAIMVSSFRSTLSYWIETSLAADLYFRPQSKLSGATESYLSPAVLQSLQSHPGVASIEELRLMDISFRDSRVLLSVSDFSKIAQRGRLSLQGSGGTQEVLTEAASKQTVLVSEAFALKYALRPGDVVELPTNTGTQTVRIQAIFYDYSNDRGTVMVDRQVFEKWNGATSFQATNLAVYLKPDHSHESVAEEFRQSLGGQQAVEIFTNASLRQEILRIFDRTFAITWTLEIIALLVAMASVATTIFTLVLERKEELRTLRQLGTSAKQMRQAFGVEGFLLGAVSQIGGLVLGTLLSVVLIYVINVQSFGWTIQFQPPWLLLLGGAALAPLATAVAATQAARGVGRWIAP